jgi:hypothetical protein
MTQALAMSTISGLSTGPQTRSEIHHPPLQALFIVSVIALARRRLMNETFILDNIATGTALGPGMGVAMLLR